ncbi:LuxR C-terminal-related transcriptional regulator [Actinomycetospora lutea]|uniref:ATP-binding protein n=1 Tax=Actinomycetospora lutea TaxID=663604 RepID=UPI002366912A|nr:LuxR family transcriptional regulator [Actinomycetospora lutea]MDD7942334.1 LuxR C-terminal-related transcriptional regulator [Actinomycetospora lutea]
MSAPPAYRGLVGRVLERGEVLAELDAALAAARAGEGRTVLLAGEAGLGKTTVLRTWTAGLAGVRLLEGACDDLVTSRTLGPFHDAALDAPDLRAALAAGGTDAVYDAVLAELAHDVTVLVVEDVHWADEATLDVLAVAARRVARLPAVLVLSYRDDEVDPGSHLQRLLGGLPAASTRRPELRPLTVGAVTELAGAAGLRVHAATLGNPFLVTELLAAQSEGLPVSVRDAVLARVADLPRPARELLELLAVIPGHADAALLEALRPAWRDDVEVPERRGIVGLTGGLDGGTVAFRHELARQAVEQALPPIRRLGLERAVLAALLAHDPPDRARILHHAARCGDVDAVLTHAPAAARAAAAAGAHQQSLAWYAQLAPHAAMLPPAEQAAIAEEHAWELYTAHRVEEAVATARHAVALREAGDDPAATVRALVGLSRHLYIRGDVADAVATLDRAVDLGPGDALAHTHRGVLRVLADDEEAGLAELAAAPPTALGTVYRGLGRAFLGHADGPDIVRAGLDAARAAGHREHAARGWTSLVKALRRLGRDDEVAAVVAEGLESTRSGDFLSHGYSLEAFGLQLMVDDGRWDAAEAGLRRLVDTVPEAGILARETLPALGRLLARRGDPDADAVLARAWELATRSDSLPVLLTTAAGLAEQAWLAGDGSREHDRIRALLARSRRPGLAGARGDLLRQGLRAGLPVATDEPVGDLWPRHALALAGDHRGAAAAWPAGSYEQALELVDGDDEESVTAGLRILDDLGAAPAARHARRRLQALGVRRIPRGPQAGTRAHPEGLTPRQADILALVADGLTNAQIADRLVLSVRTVDHHVSAVLAKLGVGSREEAARRFRDS